MSKEKHEHVYSEPVEQKVRLYSGLNEKTKMVSAIDTIKQRKCKCGKTQAYDLERQIA